MWFYKDGNQEKGPISKDELMQLIKTRHITKNTLIRNEKMNEWRPLAEMMRPKSQTSANPSPHREPPRTPPPGSDSQQGAAKPIKTFNAQIPFQFKGTGSEYFRIWIVNVLLSIITLGIYSAWAKVRRKQYFYGNTSLTEAAFRYLADPIKILKGRMIVFLGFAGYSLANQLLPAAAIVLSIGFVFILPWLVVRSLAFNARNSAWRNIRFNFTGTYGDAAKVFILWPILIPFTLGMILPYVYFRQKKFVVENSAYGSAPFVFHATSRDYYHIMLKMLLPILIVGVFAGIVMAFSPRLSFLAVSIILAMYLYAFAYFSVTSSNLLYNSGALLKHRFKATMSVNPYALIVLTNTLATVLTVGFFHPFAMIRAYRYKIHHLSLIADGDLEQFIAAEVKETSALGDELSDFMDFDFGL